MLTYLKYTGINIPSYVDIFANILLSSLHWVSYEKYIISYQLTLYNEVCFVR